MIGAIRRSITGLVAVGLLITAASPAFGAGPAPLVAGFTPGGTAPASPGVTAILDFTQPMDPASLRLTVDPATPVWTYWASPTQLVVLPQARWRPLTSYHLTVGGTSTAGAALSGQRVFAFQTGRGVRFGEGCAGRTITYHINGRPKSSELPENFVSWAAFKLQIQQLRSMGFTFGAPDQVCWPGNERMISLQFDDGWATQFPAAEWLASQGIVAFFAITTANLGRGPYLTHAQVTALARMGMIIGSHLVTHDCLSASTFGRPEAERASYLDRQLRESQQILRALSGQPVSFLVYPYGCFDATIARAAQRYYSGAWTTARSLSLPADLRAFARQRLTANENTRFLAGRGTGTVPGEHPVLAGGPGAPHARWLAQSPYPRLAPGETADVSISFANTGGTTFRRGFAGEQLNLAVDGDSVAAHRLGIALGWLSENRVASTVAATVAPGDTAEFRFRVRAPATPGVYTIHLRPVVDGTAWLEDEGVFLNITVLPRATDTRRVRAPLPSL